MKIYEEDGFNIINLSISRLSWVDHDKPVRLLNGAFVEGYEGDKQ